MTDEEKKQLLQLIFTEIPTDHTGAGRVRFEVRRHGEPYVEFVQAGRRQKEPGLSTSERKTGLNVPDVENKPARSRRTRLAAAGGLTLLSRRAKTREAVKGRPRISSASSLKGNSWREAT
jgi:hypothetical protein